MRTSLLSVFMACAACLVADAAMAQDTRAAPGPAPTPQQLLQVEVGGTHIPVQATPPEFKNPYEGNSDAVVQGRALFNSMNCVGCHAPHGGGGMGPPLSDKQWIYGGKPDQIYLTILQGRPNGMPAFGKLLPSDSIWKLVTYVSTLSEPGADPLSAQQAGAHPAGTAK